MTNKYKESFPKLILKVLIPLLFLLIFLQNSLNNKDIWVAKRSITVKEKQKILPNSYSLYLSHYYDSKNREDLPKVGSSPENLSITTFKEKTNILIQGQAYSERAVRSLVNSVVEKLSENTKKSSSRIEVKKKSKNLIQSGLFGFFIGIVISASIKYRLQVPIDFLKTYLLIPSSIALFIYLLSFARKNIWMAQISIKAPQEVELQIPTNEELYSKAYQSIVNKKKLIPPKKLEGLVAVSTIEKDNSFFIQSRAYGKKETLLILENVLHQMKAEKNKFQIINVSSPKYLKYLTSPYLWVDYPKRGHIFIQGLIIGLLISLYRKFANIYKRTSP